MLKEKQSFLCLRWTAWLPCGRCDGSRPTVSSNSKAGVCNAKGMGPPKLRDNHVANFAGESNPTSYKKLPKPRTLTHTQQVLRDKNASQCSTSIKKTKHKRSKDDNETNKTGQNITNVQIRTMQENTKTKTPRVRPCKERQNAQTRAMQETKRSD